MGIIRRKKEKLIERFNDLVSDIKEEFRMYCEELSPKMLDTGFYHISAFEIACKEVFSLRYCAAVNSVKELAGELHGRLETLMALRDEKKKEAAEYWEMAKKNKDALNSFDGKTPLFFTLRLLNDNTKCNFIMCYEFKKIEDGVFQAYVFDTQAKSGHIMIVPYYEYVLEEMTEDEFENKYIIGRMALSSFDNENEAIEYDNSIRRLFNGQRRHE